MPRHSPYPIELSDDQRVALESLASHYGFDMLAPWSALPERVREVILRGSKGEEPFATFADAVHQALAEGEAHDLSLIGEAASEQWQAAACAPTRLGP